MLSWLQVIEQNGGEVDDSYSNRVTHVLCEHQHSDVFSLVRGKKKLCNPVSLNAFCHICKGTLLSPVKTRGYRVELVRPSVCPSVRPSVCPA